MRILVVEDQHRIAQSIKQGLMQEGYAVDVAFDGEEGLNTALADEYDAIVMDVMMPKLSGVEVVKRLRDANSHTPVLLLTAKSQSEDIIAGLDAGADDYLPKPFSFDVLLARIRALLRRPAETIDTVLSASGLELDTARHRVQRDGTELRLSGKEYAILEYLLRNKGRILSKNNIISHVWDFDADVLPNSVEVFIGSLRAKVDKPFAHQPPLIQTVRGFGYVIQDASA